MNPSAILYAAADYMREHGFSPDMGEDGCPRCLIGALFSIEVARIETDKWGAAEKMIFSVAGSNLSEIRLLHDGWNTDDAVAALTIAADIAFEDERARGTT